MIKLSSQSLITASAGANGGNIFIATPDILYLIESEISAVAGGNGGSGTGGNFTIDAQFIVLNNSSISTNAAPGQGGNQNLNFEFLFANSSSITATGVIVATGAVDLDLGSQLITLPNSLISAENQLQERCASLLQGDFSSFITVGRGGTEAPPDELQTTF